MRLRLVPISCTRVIVRKVVVVSVFNGNPDRLLKVNRILYMESIKGILPAPRVFGVTLV